jgi:glycosyltransferase involved in cell wall biosynthesis
MAIVLMGDSFSFPEGNSATNRIYTYAKGFIENGINAYVISVRNDYIKNGNGVINRIQYFNPIDRSERSNSFFLRNWYKIAKYPNTIRLIRKINRQDKISAIIIDTYNFSMHLFCFCLARMVGAKLLIEKCEHPLRLHQKGTLKKIQGLIKLRIESRLNDGQLCISRFLVNYYLDYGISPAKLIMTPSTADPEKFSNVGDKPVPYKYIGYFGGLTFERDNVDLLIKAFAPLSKKYPDYHLVVGGMGSDKERSRIINLFQELNISSQAVLLEYLPRSEVASYIAHADVLVMVRAIDFETQASFPSKLTEYLVTSKPVISVNIAEVSDYITDGVNGLLIEPGNLAELTEKLDWVLNNYESALEIAKKGKLLTDTIFNYDFQAKRILDFLNSLTPISTRK